MEPGNQQRATLKGHPFYFEDILALKGLEFRALGLRLHVALCQASSLHRLSGDYRDSDDAGVASA